MSAQDWTVCTEHDITAHIEWDDHTYDTASGPVVHGVATCVFGCWWNVYGDAWTVLSGEEA